MLFPERPLGAIVAATLIAAVVWRMTTREGGRPLWLPTTAVLIAALAASMLAKNAAAGLWLPAATLVLVGAVGFVIWNEIRDQWIGRAQ